MWDGALDVLDELPDQLSLSVNLSPTALLRPDVTELLLDASPGRLLVEITEHAPVTSYEDLEAARFEQLEHELRLAVLQRKREAITALRDANTIDDYVLRDLQAGLDIEEIRLLGAAPLE